MLSEPGSGEWPQVTHGGPEPPYVDRVAGEDASLGGPKELVAYGTVAGIPWSLVAVATRPLGNWWDSHAKPVGPHLEFFLGHFGRFGGARFYAQVPDGSDLAMVGCSFGRLPGLVAWLGLVSQRVRRIEVRLADGRVRALEPAPGLTGFPRWFVVFPPHGVEGEVVALGPEDRVLEAKRLRDGDTSPNWNRLTVTNPVAWPSDHSPPGWPQDEPPPFAPGEGLRQEEDFFLHVAPFSLYVLPPRFWAGVVGVGGSTWRDHKTPAQVAFLYLDQVGHPRRGFEVLSGHAANSQVRLAHKGIHLPKEQGIWWNGQQPGDHDVWNFVGRFLAPEARLDRGEVGPRRFLGSREVHMFGASRAVERWVFLRHPDLLLARLPLPEALVTVLGWGLRDQELLGFVARLERLKLRSDLFREMEDA